MKRLLHLIVFVFAASSLFGQAIPNGGFESWTTTTWMDPTGYFSSSDRYVPYGAAATCVQSSSAYHGKYAVQVTTTKSGNDTLQAYFANGNPGGTSVPGGTPYTQKPTGLRIYYKCNIMPGDTGYVLAIFKKGGSVIAQYPYKVHGTVASYTLLAETFSPALSTNPDTVVFGVTPSNIVGGTGNFKGIPGSTITVDSLTFTGVTSQPAGINGDFENWTTNTSMFPTGWIGVWPGVYQTTDMYAGNYAVELQTNFPISNGSAQPGFITTGNWNPNGGGNVTGGRPYTMQTDTFSFYYKYSPVNGDTAGCFLEFKKGGSMIGGANGFYLVPEASYTLAKIGYNIGSVPDTVIVQFQSTINGNVANKHVGSTFKVDNAQFKSSPLAVNFIVVPEGAIKVYPNPTTSAIHIDTRDLSGSVQSIELYDMSGRMISSVNNVSTFRNDISTIDMSNCAVGMYLLHISTSEGSYYQKINKQ